MTKTLTHRGPDDEGIFVAPHVGLGHRRLSIIDLESGHQPMQDDSGRFTIVFNGEIYNYRELREELIKKGHCFKSQSDTEVILVLYREYGVGCLEKLRGMFAFALWDSKEQKLFLARDRVGKKPLFYFLDNNTFLFGSEIKAILEVSEVPREVRKESIDDYLTYGYTPSPFTMFEGIRKLPPGHFMVYGRDGLQITRYWSLHYEPKENFSISEWKKRIWETLSESVRLRLRSDVPLGVLLSGGMDSSVVVALMHQFSGQKIKTFSIGFEEPDYNELSYARMIAHHFGTEHHEWIVRPEAMKVLPKLIWHYNEPFGDSSCIPTYYVSELTRSHVKVALNGDGGDEAFAGYDRYRGLKLSKHLEFVPSFVVEGVKEMYAFFLKSLTKDPKRGKRILHFLEALIDSEESSERYLRWVSIFLEKEKKAFYTDEFREMTKDHHAASFLLKLFSESKASSIVDRALDIDTHSYLPEDLLVKMDIASMAHGLEVRSPFLDQEFLELMGKMPVQLKMKGLRTKYLLREITRNVLPASVQARRKMGFGVPIDHWFRTDLKTFVEEVLLDNIAIQRGYFNKDAIIRLLKEHQEGKEDHRFRLWALLNLELWHRMFIDQKDIPQGLEKISGEPITVSL